MTLEALTVLILRKAARDGCNVYTDGLGSNYSPQYRAWQIWTFGLKRVNWPQERRHDQ